MRLNKEKPYGQIWGHSQAVYEQNGVLFDGAGEVVVPDETRELEDDIPREDIHSFIQSVLAGGSVAQSNIYKDSEAHGFIWAEVKTVAAEMGVRVYQRGKVDTWSLIGA